MCYCAINAKNWEKGIKQLTGIIKLPTIDGAHEKELFDLVTEKYLKHRQKNSPAE